MTFLRITAMVEYLGLSILGIGVVVLAVAAERQSNPGIAARLGLTSKTTSNYVSSILTKLQVPDRYAAARLARGLPG